MDDDHSLMKTIIRDEIRFSWSLSFFEKVMDKFSALIKLKKLVPIINK